MSKVNSQTTEDYLKAVYTLEKDNKRVKTSNLAKHLGLTPGSVTDMLKRLSSVSPPLLDYRHHRGVKLTAAGRKVALGVIRRHRLLETFLNRILGFGWDEVHQEAEVLEHHLSERLTDAIDRLLNYPATDPHGEVIPSKDGEIAPETQVRLSDVSVGRKVKVVRVDPHQSDMLGYLDQLGIGVETLMSVEQHGPFQGPVTLKIDVDSQTDVCVLGREITDHIYVSILS
jgi:DtxR family Mn-dependent transcriptional regulator